jgi:serine/threonine protein kinase
VRAVPQSAALSLAVATAPHTKAALREAASRQATLQRERDAALVAAQSIATPLQPAADAAIALQAADAFLGRQVDIESVVALQTTSAKLQGDFDAFGCAQLLERLRDAEAAVLCATPGQHMNEAAAKRDLVRREVAAQLKTALPVASQLMEQLVAEQSKLQPLCIGERLDGVDVLPAAVMEQHDRVLSLRRKTLDSFAALSKHHSLMSQLWATSATGGPSEQQQASLVDARAKLTSLEKELQQVNAELQSAVSLLVQRVKQAQSTVAKRLGGRWAEVGKQIRVVGEQVELLRSRLDELDSAITACAEKDSVVKGVKDALDRLDEMREELHIVQLRTNRGRATQPDVAACERLVAEARAAYNVVARQLLLIAAAGFPELQLGAVSRHQSLLHSVPTIGVAELTALGEPDDTNLMGEGAVSSVHRLALVNGAVAFKRFKANVGSDEMLREANTLWGLRHPNIVQLLMVCVDKGNVGLVLELMDTSLDAVLHKQKKKLSLHTLMLYLCDITAAVAYLHERNTVHLDLKSANVLLRGGVAKIADFGTTKVVRETVYMTKLALSPNWCAPEYLRETQSPKPSADVWSVGMVLYEMCTGTVPYEGSGHKGDVPSLEVVSRVLRGELPTVAPSVDSKCAEWMAKCWLPANDRITAKSLHSAVKEALTRKCNLLCTDSFLLNRGGFQCGAGKHFRCVSCLQDELSDALADGRVQLDASLQCRKCSEYGDGTPFAAEAFRDVISPALWDHWYRACTEQNYKVGLPAVEHVCVFV